MPLNLAQMENFKDVTEHKEYLLMLPSRLKEAHNTFHLPVSSGVCKQMQNIFITKTEITLFLHT